MSSIDCQNSTIELAHQGSGNLRHDLTGEELGNHCPPSLIPTKLVPGIRTPLQIKYPQTLAGQEKAASSASNWQNLIASRVLWKNKEVWEISFPFFCNIERRWNGQKEGGSTILTTYSDLVPICLLASFCASFSSSIWVTLPSITTHPPSLPPSYPKCQMAWGWFLNSVSDWTNLEDWR